MLSPILGYNGITLYVQAIMLHNSKSSDEVTSSTPSSPTGSIHHNDVTNHDVTNN